MYCQKCGKELDENAVYCSSCGTSVDGRNTYNAPGKTAYYMPYAEKSVGIALVLGFIYAGLGHLYIGKLTRGLCIMMINIALSITMVMVSLSMISDDYLTSDEAMGILIFISLFAIVAFVIWLWNLFDVNKLAKEYNDCIRRTGNPPW
jgi:Predicted membrane protein